MKTWVYSWIVYPALIFCVYPLGLFSKKLGATLRLRSWRDFLGLRFRPGRSIEYWIHVASVGELEYALPVIRELDRRGRQVLVTYYSISAKEAVESLPERHSNVALVVPLPHDGMGLMKEFVSLVRRQGVENLLLMKYELWPGLLWECHRNAIKVSLVNALKPGWFHLRLLHKLFAIIAGYPKEVRGITHKRILVFGDTRVEQVLGRIENSNLDFKTILGSANWDLILKNPKRVVLGSMWPSDDKRIFPLLNDLFEKKWNIFWIPHELGLRQLERAEREFLKVGYQSLIVSDLSQAQEVKLRGEVPIVLFIMKKGILAELYKSAPAAFVGGGFHHAGVHSVWEPAISGASVACGPERYRSPESYELEDAGILRVVQNSNEIKSWLNSAVFGEILTSSQMPKKQSPKNVDDAGSNQKIIDRNRIMPVSAILQRHLTASKQIVDFLEEQNGIQKYSLTS